MNAEHMDALHENLQGLQVHHHNKCPPRTVSNDSGFVTESDGSHDNVEVVISPGSSLSLDNAVQLPPEVITVNGVHEASATASENKGLHTTQRRNSSLKKGSGRGRKLSYDGAGGSSHLSASRNVSFSAVDLEHRYERAPMLDDDDDEVVPSERDATQINIATAACETDCVQHSNALESCDNNMLGHGKSLPLAAGAIEHQPTGIASCNSGVNSLDQSHRSIPEVRVALPCKCAPSSSSDVITTPPRCSNYCSPSSSTIHSAPTSSSHHVANSNPSNSSSSLDSSSDTAAAAAADVPFVSMQSFSEHSIPEETPLTISVDDRNDDKPSNSRDRHNDESSTKSVQIVSPSRGVTTTTPTNTSWLLRLFESKMFDMSMAIGYLFKSKEQGVQAYIGKYAVAYNTVYMYMYYWVKYV